MTKDVVIGSMISAVRSLHNLCSTGSSNMNGKHWTRVIIVDGASLFRCIVIELSSWIMHTLGIDSMQRVFLHKIVNCKVQMTSIPIMEQGICAT